jgi:hypothetical protein
VFLQPPQLVDHVLSEPLRHLTVPSSDHHVHGNLLMSG